MYLQVQLNCNLNLTVNLNLKYRCAFRWIIKGTLNYTDMFILKSTIKWDVNCILFVTFLYLLLLFIVIIVIMIIVCFN